MLEGKDYLGNVLLFREIVNERNRDILPNVDKLIGVVYGFLEENNRLKEENEKLQLEIRRLTK